MSRPPFSALLKPHFVVLLLAVLQGSCGPGYQAPPVTPQLVKIAKSPVSELERGYAIHQAKCAKCHSFENPADHEISDLKYEIMPEMAKKAKLNAADEKAVLAYLLAARKMPPAPKS